MAKSSNDRRIDYIELFVGDIARSRGFHGSAFGWSLKDYGPSYCEFNDGRMPGGFALGGDGNPGVPIKAVGVALVIPRLGYLCAAGPEHHVSGYVLANAIQV